MFLFPLNAVPGGSEPCGIDVFGLDVFQPLTPNLDASLLLLPPTSPSRQGAS